MAYPYRLFLLSVFFLSLKHLSSASSLDQNHSISTLFSNNDIHDLLPRYGFPRGILPANVKSYNLENDTGSFTIQLEAPCYVQFSELVWYEKTIKGRMSYGSARDVSGIQAKKLFIWMSVTRIDVDKDGDAIEFYAGAFYEKLPATMFQDVPTCKGKGSLRTNLSSI